MGDEEIQQEIASQYSVRRDYPNQNYHHIAQAQLQHDKDTIEEG